MTAFAPSRDTLDELHIGIKSMRSCSLSIISCLGEFVRRHVRFTRSVPTDTLDTQMLWLAVGVPSKLLDEIVTMNFFWGPDTALLYVCETLAADPRRFQRVIPTLASFCRWKNFSETRWAGVTKSTQMVVASCLVGIDSIVDLCYTLKMNTTSLPGFRRTGRAARRYACVACVAHCPLETFLCNCLSMTAS